jgi:hypothetical protein
VEPAALEKLTGMYRKVHDNTVAELRVKDGSLMFDRVALIPAGPTEFSAGERKFLFEDGRFKEKTGNGDIAYERVEPAHPSASDLAPFVGKYESPETASTLTIAAKAGELTLAVASNNPVRLRPTFRDAFMMAGEGGATSIFFHRDAAGKVTGLSAADDRVWDLRFTRVATATPSASAPR